MHASYVHICSFKHCSDLQAIRRTSIRVYEKQLCRNLFVSVELDHFYKLSQNIVKTEPKC